MLAFDIMINISGRVDMTGLRKQINLGWMEDNSKLSNHRFISRLKITESSNEKTSFQYNKIMLKFLGYLSCCLKQVYSRQLILKSLEIITKLAQNQDNSNIFSLAPTEFFQIITDLLCVSQTCVEPLVIGSSMNSDFIQQGTGGSIGQMNSVLSNLNPVTYPQMFTPSYSYSSTLAPQTPVTLSRVVPVSSGGNYYMDFNDNEIRDAALDAVTMLCQLSPKIQCHFAAAKNCLKLLLKNCDKQKLPRSDSSNKAVYLLSQLSQRPENFSKFKSLHIDMIKMACSDDLIAGEFSSVICY